MPEQQQAIDTIQSLISSPNELIPSPSSGIKTNWGTVLQSPIIINDAL
jgi:hypothetical protein